MAFTLPFPSSAVKCFAADAQDIYCDSCDSGQFVIQKNGTTILSEWYDKDANNRVTIRGLADIFATALYGTLASGQQTTAYDTFTLTYAGTQIWTGTIYAMRLRNPQDPTGAKVVLAANTVQTAYAGMPLWLTTTINGVVSTADYQSAVDAATAETLVIRSELTLHIVSKACPDAVCIRFLNRYDVAQSLVAQYFEEKPQTTDSVAVMYGKRTRFSVTPSTEYTLHSGKIHTEEYEAWMDLLTARKAEIYLHGQWIPILMTKGNYTRRRRQWYGSEVQLTFQVADPTMII